MNIALRRPNMTQAEFFAWAQVQEGRYEFDGFAPVDMNGTTINHGLISGNIFAALYNHLRGTACAVIAGNVGLQTIGQAVRYPDVLVTRSRGEGKAYLVADPLIVFEVLSPTSGRVDRIVKLREYHSVPSISRYVIVENEGIGATVYARRGSEPWTVTALSEDDVLSLPEIDFQVPLATCYASISFEPTLDR